MTFLPISIANDWPTYRTELPAHRLNHPPIVPTDLPNDRPTYRIDVLPTGGYPNFIGRMSNRH